MRDFCGDVALSLDITVNRRNRKPLQGVMRMSTIEKSSPPASPPAAADRWLVDIPVFFPLTSLGSRTP